MAEGRGTAAATPTDALTPNESPDGSHQLVGELVGTTRSATADDAVTRVVVEQTERNLVERRLDR